MQEDEKETGDNDALLNNTPPELNVVSQLCFTSLFHNCQWQPQPHSPGYNLHKGLLGLVQQEDLAKLKLQNTEGSGCTHRHGRSGLSPEEPPLSSSAPVGPWGHSLYALMAPLTDAVLRRSRRALIRHRSPRHTLPLIQSTVKPSTFGLKFHKCAQVQAGREFPQVTFLLVINNPAEGTDLSQLSIRDAVSDITLLQNSGNVQERGFQTFTTDSLPAGKNYEVTYVASIKGNRNELLALPAYLTFSNASQNDINLFGPVVANFTLRVNSTEKIYPNHGVHFAGFIGAFLLSTLVLSLGFLCANWMYTNGRRNPLQQRRKRGGENGDADPEDGVCNISEMAKEEAALEDKIVDIMVLEDPQNMLQALENLDMSNLLRGASALESSRVQMYKDVMAALLGAVRGRGLLAAQAERRLLGVLHGQLMGMEGKLKEEHVARMAALAGQCNLETREEMEAEHHREATEKAQAEVLFQHADQQEAVECSVLLDKLHKLEQNRLQRGLLVRHEQASAQVQRQIVVRRRVELHKIFSEELDEATRMGELEKNVANGLLHDYFTCQDQLEEVLDVFLANQRAVLGERHAQRRFLVQSLQSLKGLVCDVFSSTSEQIEGWFKELRREAPVSEEQLDVQLEQAKKELVRVKQALDETLNRERSAMHCDLVKKRRGLISERLREQKQGQKELSAVARGSEERVDPAQHLRCWQDLLSTQGLELGELINTLDEEAAADIRKVTMRVIQGAMPELKAVQPAAAQALLALGVPRFLLQSEAGADALSEAQERLHGEGKAAARTLRAARSSLQEASQQELQEQRALRSQARSFFRSLCVSQLTLSEEDLLRMKLEFQKRLSRLDHCLVLPRALSRSRFQAVLSKWRKEALECLEHRQEGPIAAPPEREAERKPRARAPSSEAKQTEARQTEARQMEVRQTEARQTEARQTEVRQTEARQTEARQTEVRQTEARQTEARQTEARQTEARQTEARQNCEPSDLQLFRSCLEDRIQLLEQEKEMESTAMTKVMEELCGERQEELRAQEESLAVEMASLHYEKAEKRVRALETHTALISLQSLLVQELRATGTLQAAETTQSIHNHSLALEEAELQLQRERAEWEELVGGRGLKAGSVDLRGSANEEEEAEEDEEQGLFCVNSDCRIAQSLQEALCKREQLTTMLTDRLKEAEARSQVIEDLKEQLELKRLYTSCDQDLDFAAGLVRQSLVPVPVLQEGLRLLLPTLPEGELLSLSDALCPKPPPSEHDPKGWAGRQSRSMVVRQRKDIVSSNLSPCSQDKDSDKDKDRLLKKRQNLLEKLFSASHPEGSRDVLHVLVREKNQAGGVVETPQETEPPKCEAEPELPAQDPTTTHLSVTGPHEDQWGGSLRGETGGAGGEAGGDLGQATSAGPHVVVDVAWDQADTGERVFVFRCPPPDAQDCGDASGRKKKKKRNFLNFKKGSVAPQDQP